jgi:acetyl/propionyl-CoA carboxylase alpha subunit
MIAKLIVWGENRVEAILRMRRALREYQVRGIKTNIPFHQWILRHPRSMAGDFDTSFIDEEYRFTQREELYPHKDIALASAAIAALYRQRDKSVLRPVEAEAMSKGRWRQLGRIESLGLVIGSAIKGKKSQS